VHSKRLSLIDVLTLATTLALAVALFVPGRSMSDDGSKQKVCSANLRGMGQALYIYAQDGDVFPMSAERRKENDGAMVLFNKATRDKAPAADALPSPTVDLWAVIRQNNATPKQFTCPLTKDEPDTAQDVTSYFDFLTATHLSYAYQYQYDRNLQPLGTGSDPTRPLVADSNPYLKGGIKAAPLADRLSEAKGNSTNHGESRPSQNVLFVDGHVSLEKSPDCGVAGVRNRVQLPSTRGRDHIYTVHKPHRQVDPGFAAPTSTQCNLGSKSDSCLVP